jgi:hypothetical protein
MTAEIIVPASWWATVGRKPEETPPIWQDRKPEGGQTRFSKITNSVL